MPKKSRSSSSSAPPIDTTYAWRPGIGPSTPICNVSFSPLYLHVAANILATGSSISPAEPFAAAGIRFILLSFLGSNDFGRLPDNAASFAISTATARLGDGLSASSRMRCG